MDTVRPSREPDGLSEAPNGRSRFGFPIFLRAGHVESLAQTIPGGPDGHLHPPGVSHQLLRAANTNVVDQAWRSIRSARTAT